MSKFNIYARRLDDAAKKIFGEYQEKQTAVKMAEQARNNVPRRGDVPDAARAVATARAEADYLEAKSALDAARRRLPERGEEEMRAIRRELVNAVNDAFIADPSKIDQNVITLLQSGICTAADYEKLMADAGSNPTMIRLIASYAAKAADAIQENGRVPYDKQGEWARLADVGKQGQAHTAAAVLDTFDGLCQVFRRCMDNPGMFGHWAELTESAIGAF